MTAPLDPFAGVVTAADVYAKVEQVRVTLGELGVKLDGVADDMVDLKAGHKDHEERLRAVEGERWPRRRLMLIAAVAGVFLTAAGLVFAVASWALEYLPRVAPVVAR